MISIARFQWYLSVLLVFPFLFFQGSNCTCHKNHLRMERQTPCVLCVWLREQNLPTQIPAKMLLGLSNSLVLVNIIVITTKYLCALMCFFVVILMFALQCKNRSFLL